MYYSSKKSMPRWSSKVRIAPGAGVDRTLDDGFSWRKYGQKDILGAKFPRLVSSFKLINNYLGK